MGKGGGAVRKMSPHIRGGAGSTTEEEEDRERKGDIDFPLPPYTTVVRGIGTVLYVVYLTEPAGERIRRRGMWS